MPRKEKKYHYIYKTTNLINDKYYLGMHSTDDLNDGYLGSGKRLKNSIHYHGKENFKVEILEYCKNREELKKREKEIITLNEVVKFSCMNLVVGGEGGFISLEGTKKGAKITNKFIKEEKLKNSNWYKTYLENHSNGLKNAYKNGNRQRKNVFDWTGMNHSEETKEKMRKPKNLGEVNSQYGTRWVTNNIDNKKIKRGDLIPEGWKLGRKIQYLN